MAISETFETALRLSARRAYEMGRLQSALRLGAAAAALALPGLLYCQATALAALCLAAFALVVVAGRVRGEGYEEGARAGMLAGVLPCLIPAVLHVANPALCAALCTNRPWLCAAGGVVAGVILGLRSRTAGGLPFWASALVALGFASALGCLPAGVLGFTGLVLGVIAGGAPVLVARRSLA
jgi:hypothetical protein